MPQMTTIRPQSLLGITRMCSLRLSSARLLSAVFLCWCSTTLLADEPQFVAGNHYQLLHEAQPIQSGDKIEVLELFWYECPHCYRLEPFVTQWRKNKPQNAEFIAMPAILNKSWEFNARMYYTLQALGLDEALHAEVFEAIHVDQRPLRTIQEFTDWAVEHGANREALVATSSSFAVQNKVHFATIMSRKYGISGVPAIIIDGKYRTSATLAGGNKKLFEVINYLVKLAAEQRSG